MSDTAQLLEVVNGLKASYDAMSTRLDEMSKSTDDARTSFLGGAPHARRGEDPFASRGFQYGRVIGVLSGKMDAVHAKVEMDLCKRLHDEYVQRGFYNKEDAKSVVVPLSSDFIHQTSPDMAKMAAEVGEIVRAGVSGFDRDEASYFLQKRYGFAKTKALSWLDESGLGNLVGPAVHGEPIELLRNQEVFMKAGATVVPFPPSGRMTWPRFTGATTGYWVGTSTNGREITASSPTTGDVVLQVKKLGVLVNLPNELFRFPTVSVEAILRADMMKTAALTLDTALLEDVGSGLTPKGIIRYSNILSHTASTTGVNGDTFEPEDVLQMVAKVEEKNVNFNTFVGRPLMYAAIGNRRADAVTAGDKKGPWLFNITREKGAATDDVSNYAVGSLEGYPFHKSNQISNTRAKGGSSALTYVLGGDFSRYVLALSGVMEFAVSNVGDTNFPQDKSSIRMITWADGAPTYEEAFILCDSLVVG